MINKIKFLKNTSLKTKIVISFMLGVLATSLIAGALFHHYYNQEATEVGENQVNQLKHIFEEEAISPNTAGQMTEDFVNTQILGPSPNNVTAEFKTAERAYDENLRDFYRVEIQVSNPSGTQETEVFTKKDGSLVFLQFPRKLDGEEFDPNQYH